jgi:predicted acetyltransferase
MTTDLRPIEPNERNDWIRSLHVPFLESPNEDTVRHWEDHLETDRAWLAFDEKLVVGNCCIFSRNVSVPGTLGAPCPTMPLAAISGVGVHPTHRRRGLLRRMMGAMLHNAVERGEPAAGLLASEASIYGRFGFGWATSSVRITLPKRLARIAVPVPELELRLCSAEEARERIPALFEQARLRRPGELNRNAASWSDTFTRRRRTGSTGERFFVLGAEGYVTYRAANNWSEEPTTLRVDDLFGMTGEVEAGLWKFLLEIDLVDSVVATRPLDEPIRWRLEDPRAMAVTSTNDRLWLRLLDLPTALTTRKYRTEGRLVLHVDPATHFADQYGEPAPDPAAGRWVLEAGPDGASCRPAHRQEPSELRMGAATLASVFLGGHDFSSHAAAGLVTELRSGALARADVLFGTRPLPFSSTGF